MQRDFKKNFHIVCMVSLLASIATVVTVASLAPVSSMETHSNSRQNSTDSITVHAAGRGNPQLNLSDGRDVLTAYSGAAEPRQVLEQNLARPLSLAAADFDEDGVPDLVSGYAGPNGGIITLHRGNVDSIYPNAPDAQKRRADGAYTDSPFLSPARVFEVAEAVDFVGAGDFDGDSHWDVVAAMRGSNKLHLLSGDGQGNFAAAREITLLGVVTALVTGEINRRDGLDDVVVGVVGGDGPKVLVFEGPNGALRAMPEAFPLPAEAASMALGQLDDEYTMDLAVAAGNDLIMIRGRDRKLSLDEIRQAEVKPAEIGRRAFPFAIRAIAIGDFTGEHRSEIALLSAEGEVQVLADSNAKEQERGDLRRWQVQNVARVSKSAHLLIQARVSSRPVDEMIVIDSSTRRLQIIGSGEELAGNTIAERAGIAASLEVESEPVAVLPMRLNGDALNDLVILRAGRSVPSVTMTQPVTTFTVTNTSDSGTGSLRQAIIDANANAGLDTISFSIGSGVKSINVGSSTFMALPTITSPVTIDGTTQPGFSGSPLIELNGIGTGASDGLLITAGSSTIKGLVINRFSVGGIRIETGGGNVVVGNYIGTDVNGTADLGNSYGVFITNSAANNTVGGTSATLRNIISGYDILILINNSASGNTVQGNYIGTDVTGTATLGGSNGIRIEVAPNNTIGGTAANARNIISGNSFGIVLTNASTGNLVQGNSIGTDVTGTAALGNTLAGVDITFGSTNNTIGGTSVSAGNIIAFNNNYGILVIFPQDRNNAILSNSIHSNTGLGIDLGFDGITANDACDGASAFQNFPVLTSASTTAIQGTLNSTANSVFTIQFFSNSACDPSGYGEGQTFIGSLVVLTNASCNASFTFPTSLSQGQVITATATNSSGNTSEFSACVTVGVPSCTITCPVNQTVNNAPGQCSAVINYPAPSTTGTCGTITCAPPSGSTFNLGTTTVTCTTTAGPSCSFTVTVNDTQPPSITCPANITVPENPPGSGGAVVSYTAPTVGDNCPGVGSPSCVPPSGFTFPVGTTTVNCSMMDAHNNINACSFTVTVTVSQPACDILVNRSFETGPAIPNGSSYLTLGAGSTAVTGWVVTGSTIDYIGPSWTVSDGIRAIELDGAFSTGGIQQTFSTTPGQTYLVSFDLSGNPEGAPQTKQVRVAVDGFTQDYSFNTQGQTRSTLIWETKSFTFVASGTTATLSFTSLSPAGNSWGGLIDKVCVSLSNPTEATISSFTATAYKQGVFLQWRTGYEVDNLGFNIYRENLGRRYKVNPELVAGTALMVGAHTVLSAGQTYGWWDNQSGIKETQYWLEAVDLNGKTQSYGPASVNFVGGNPPQSSQADLLSRVGVRQSGTTAPVSANEHLQIRTFALDPAPVNLAGQQAIKIGISSEGWYRVSQPELVSAGLLPDIDPRYLQFYAHNQELPILVVGEQDGKFDAQDAIEFYAKGLDTPYTDTRVYWLVVGTQPGLRITTAQMDKAAPENSSSFTYTVERKDRSIYFVALRNGDEENFFGPVITSSGVDQSLSLRHIDGAANADAVIEVALQGVTLASHKVSLSFNGVHLGEQVFTGQEHSNAKFAVPHSMLREGSNQVLLTSVGGSMDISLVDYVRLTYQHLYRAESNSLIFTTNGERSATIDGFSNGHIRVIEITDASNVQELTAEVNRGKVGYSVTVGLSGSGQKRMLAFTDEQIQHPVWLVGNRPSRLRQATNAADLLIISRRGFFDVLQPLVALRQSEGMRVGLVDIEDLFDEFSFGEKSPQAIKDFLSYAKTKWKRKPGYVVMAGDASLDARNYLGFGDFDFVPTKLVDTTYMETASDEWLADINDDGEADLAIGRLPFRTAQQATTMVSKIIEYERSDASASVLLVSDANDGYNFEVANEQLKPFIPRSLQVEQVRRGEMGDVEARTAVLEAINRGQKIVNYTGHGNVSKWNGGLLTAEDTASLDNRRLSVFVMMTCLNGFFQDAVLDSLAEGLMKSQRGAVAVWASSGLAQPDDQALVNRELYRVLFETSNRSQRLGDAIMRAKAAVANHDIRRTWALVGDPSMRL